MTMKPRTPAGSAAARHVLVVTDMPTARLRAEARSISSSCDGHIRFEVSLADAERRGLKLSSRMLAVARRRRARDAMTVLIRTHSIRYKLLLVVLATTLTALLVVAAAMVLYDAADLPAVVGRRSDDAGRHSRR